MSISNSLININLYKANIKNSIENKLGNNVDIGYNLSLYPNYIRQIKELSAETIDSFTGSTVIDKCHYIQYLKGKMADAIQACGVSSFNRDNFSTYSSAISRIKTTYDFVIQGPNVMSGESFSVISVFDNTIDVTTASTWSITNGNQYATISDGDVTILSGANASNITIQAIYSAFTATSIVEVTYLAGTSAETQTNTVTDESGNTTTTTTTVITNQDGSSSSQSTSINYDAMGNEIGSSENETIVNADGSSQSTTINYDENGDPASRVNESIDTSGNEKTQEIEYDEDGDEIVISYIVNTENNPDGELDFNGSSEDAINTSFQPFNFDLTTDGFDMVIYFRATLAEQKDIAHGGDTDTQWTFLDMTPDDSDASWRYNQGIVIRMESSDDKAAWQIRTANKGNVKNTVNPTTIDGVSGYYKLGLRYYGNKLVFRNLLTNTNIQTITKSPMFEVNPNNPDKLKNTNVTIGSAWDSTNNTQFRFSTMELLDFHINKIHEWYDY